MKVICLLRALITPKELDFQLTILVTFFHLFGLIDVLQVLERRGGLILVRLRVLGMRN